MKKAFRLTIILFLFQNVLFGQSIDTTIKMRGHGSTTYFIDGFKVYNTKLTKADSIKILKDVVSSLNGCWSSDKLIHSFKLSDKTFAGTWDIKGIHSTSPLVRLELINGQVKLIVTDVIGGDGNPRNIRVDEKELALESVDGKETLNYKRMKKCP